MIFPVVRDRHRILQPETRYSAFLTKWIVSPHLDPSITLAIDPPIEGEKAHSRAFIDLGGFNPRL